MQTKYHLNGKEIDLTGDNVTIKSENFTVDKNGNLICNNGTFRNGKLIVIDQGEISDPCIDVSSKDNTSDSELSVKINSYGINLRNYMRSAGDLRCEIDASGINIKQNKLVARYSQESVSLSNNDTKDLVLIGCDGFFVTNNNNTTNIQATGITTPKLTQTSLKSKKKNIQKLNVNATDLIKNADICLYNLKGEKKGTKKHVGLVIGEGYNCPELVISEDGQGVEQYSMTSVVWKAMQELTERVEKLEGVR